MNTELVANVLSAQAEQKGDVAAAYQPLIDAYMTRALPDARSL